MSTTYTALENAQMIYSDLYKSVYGFRPRFLNELTATEIYNDIEVLQRQLDSEFEAERAYEAAHPDWARWEREEEFREYSEQEVIAVSDLKYDALMEYYERTA